MAEYNDSQIRSQRSSEEERDAVEYPLLRDTGDYSQSDADNDSRGSAYPPTSCESQGYSSAQSLASFSSLAVETLAAASYRGKGYSYNSVTSIETIQLNENLPLWELDASVKECRVCGESFGFFSSKHHCRSCGFVVCNECSDIRSPMRWLGYSQHVRICKQCAPIVRLKIQTFSKPQSTEKIDIVSDDDIKWWMLTLSRWSSSEKTNRQKIGQKIWKGIPLKLRGNAWYIISGAEKRKKDSPGLWESLIDRLELDELDTEVWESIIRDVTRTFPDHPYFREVYSLGQKGLIKILSAYALFDPQVGYAQGMNFICGMLLLYLDEENAFWVFVQMMKQYKLCLFFEHGCQYLEQVLTNYGRLVEKLLPRLHHHFETQQIIIPLIAQQWFRTLFAYSLPYKLVSRIWDVFFVEGLPSITWLCLMILKHHEEELLKLPFFGINQFLREKISAHTIESLLSKQVHH